jgi:hypothetical protein
MWTSSRHCPLVRLNLAVQMAPHYERLRVLHEALDCAGRHLDDPIQRIEVKDGRVLFWAGAQTSPSATSTSRHTILRVAQCPAEPREHEPADALQALERVHGGHVRRSPARQLRGPRLGSLELGYRVAAQRCRPWRHRTLSEQKKAGRLGNDRPSLGARLGVGVSKPWVCGKGLR